MRFEVLKGLVIKSTGSWYTVLMDDGQLLDCKIKGNFRLRGIRSTNPVAVGDRVEISYPSPSTLHYTPFITDIEDRRNYIIRKSINLSKQSHIIAANVDQALLIVTVAHPQTSTTFIDRFLASAEAYRVPVILVFNKTDRLTPDELRLQQMMVTLYETIGYQCRQISATRGDGVEELRPLLEGKITLLSGNSGVGKSTLINRLVPGANLRTADISDAHDMGIHTTTFSEMIGLPPTPIPEGGLPARPSGTLSLERTRSLSKERGSSDSEQQKASPLWGRWEGALIDTPGIKGFGTFDMEPEELTSYFPEIFRYSKDCRFSNCTHTHEPGCAVLKALDDHLIAQSRYQSYLSMMADKDDSKYRQEY